MLLTQIISVCFLAFGCTAVPTPTGHVLHEKRDASPRQWVKRSKVDQQASLPVRIGLTQSGLDQGAAFLNEVSTPGSPRYGQYYTPEEVHDIFAPSEEAVAVVTEWLHTSGD